MNFSNIINSKAYIIVEKVDVNPNIKDILKYCEKCNSLEIHYKKLDIRTCNVDLRFLALKIIPTECYYKNLHYNNCYKCIESIETDIRLENNKKIFTETYYDECNCVYYIHILLPEKYTCKKDILLYIKKFKICFDICTKKFIDKKDFIICTIPPELIKKPRCDNKKNIELLN